MAALSPTIARPAAPAAFAAPVLTVRGLTTRFSTPDGPVAAVSGVDLDIAAGETIGVVGESGSGKSQLFLSMLGLVAANGQVTGSVRFEGHEILGLPAKRLNRIRGARIAMIFQDPMTSLNPYLTVERQMTEVLEVHHGAGRAEARARAIDMLDLVRIPEARRRIGMYPHEFSGGMRQRVMIAMALLCRPSLLVADEPTTALDVTIQAQILELMGELKRELNTAIVLITHDLGVVAGLADRMLVMYAGRVVEQGPVRDLFYAPQHPYTEGLLAAMPRLNSDRHAELPSIGGQPPNLQALPPGCRFAPRCGYVHGRCRMEDPPLREAVAPPAPGASAPRVSLADDPADARLKACHLVALPPTPADLAEIAAVAPPDAIMPTDGRRLEVRP